jgi:hypothetical protein
MPRISEKPMIRLHVRIWAEDKLALDQMFGSSDLTRTRAIRDIIHEYVKHTRAKAQAEIDSFPPFADLTHELDEILP